MSVKKQKRRTLPRRKSGKKSKRDKFTLWKVVAGTFKFLRKVWTNQYAKLLAKIATGLIILAVFMATILIAYYAHDLPDIEKLAEDHKRPMVTIRSSSGEILANYGDIYGKALSYGQIPQNIVHAVLAIEDRRFFAHSGIDYWGVLRAIYRNQIAGKVVQGGSTITQQLAKIIFLSPDRTLKRKVQEAMLATQLEKIFSKEQILAMYLNRVFLGQANFGIDAAARYYFAKPVEKLTLYEAAVIAGMLKAPSKYGRSDGHKDAIRRGRQVLVNMKAAGFISEAELKQASPPQFISRGKARGSLQNPYFADYALEQVTDLVGQTGQSINVYTPLIPELQTKLEQAIDEILNPNAEKFGISQVAAVVMSRDGYIQAMTGGRSYAASQFNRAAHAQRQSGSAFKLFVYLAALENGYQLDQMVEDKAIMIGKWEPQNYTRQYLGMISLRDAFAKSINTVAVQLSESVGRHKVIEMATRLGVHGPIMNLPSIALGSVDMTPLNLTSAYAIVANDGYFVQPVSILRIQDSDGKTIYTHHKPDHVQVLSDEIVSDISELLKESVDRGTSHAAALNNLQAFGKTGTSQRSRDAWFIGFAGDLVVGIWVGNDDNKPMKQVTGGMIPAKIFKSLMGKIYG